VGDYAIIHVGFALNLVSEDEAQETLKLFEQIARSGIPEDEQLHAEPSQGRQQEQ
jgi:hydrogenase expression/formation protein HypC